MKNDPKKKKNSQQILRIIYGGIQNRKDETRIKSHEAFASYVTVNKKT